MRQDAESIRLPDGALMGDRDEPLGGQAVLEGVMMRSRTHCAVAMRLQSPDDEQPGPIEVETISLARWRAAHPIARLPIIRGVYALAGSLAIGFKALQLSMNAQMPDDEEPIEGGAWGAAIAATMVFAFGLFFVIPVALTSLVEEQLESSLLFWIVEGALRTGILLGYLALLSRVRDLRRVFEYHGAEHKVIACYEAGEELEPANAARYSRLHPRCGTSFLLIVVLVAIVVFAPLGLPEWYWLAASRVVGLPLIAGIAFEVIKWAGRNRGKGWVRHIMWPGLQLQKLTTREPSAEQLEVAIAAMRVALDETQAYARPVRPAPSAARVIA